MRNRRIGIILALALAAMVLLGIYALCRKRSGSVICYAEDTSIFGNPLMGFAPSSWYPELPESIQLIYMDITWRELEPEEGRFAWQSIDEKNQLAYWRAQGRHIVLRFVCDVPGREPHRDVPDWLFEKLGDFGEEYDMEYGRGFAPDYSNARFLEYHNRAVRALGEHYGGDGFVSFVELGSLGHWGEWHVNYDAGLKRLPDTQTRSAYVEPWLQAFPQAKLLMRRPFTHAQEYGFGIYNDVFGSEESTDIWLDWIANGGIYDQTGEVDALVPLPEQWKTAPVGGELTSSLPMEEILTANLPETARQLAASHATFLGPKTAMPWEEEGYRTLLANLGYRLWISRMTLRQHSRNAVEVELTWQNSGVAPFFFDWPVTLTVCNAAGDPLLTAPVEIDLRTILPGTQITSTTLLRGIPPDMEDTRLLLGIPDPMTGQNAVRLAMNTESEENASVLFPSSTTETP